MCGFVGHLGISNSLSVAEGYRHKMNTKAFKLTSFLNYCLRNTFAYGRLKVIYTNMLHCTSYCIYAKEMTLPSIGNANAT